MKTGIITENIWENITDLTAKSKSKSFIAVAYFGIGASKMLPLKKGSVLVVDASEDAVKSGQTNPYELLKLYNQGVEIYTWDKLHAKMFVISNHLIIGSTNVSKNSEGNLQEAVFVTDEINQVKKAIEFIKSICLNDLGLKALEILCIKYNKPKTDYGDKVYTARNLSNTFLINLEPYDFSEEENEVHKIELQKAKHKIDTKKHRVDYFKFYYPNNFDIESKILQVYEEKRQTFVYPIGTIIRIKSLKNGQCLIYLEVQKNIKEKSIKDFDKIIQKRLKRDGRIAQNLVDRINLTIRTKSK